MRFLFRLLVFCVAVLSMSMAQSSASDQSAPIRVAAAADLRFALNELGQAFPRQTGIRIEPVYGSSANLVSQIENGAPFDVYLAADESFARKLERDGFAVPDTFLVYAIGKLALVSRRSATPRIPADLENAKRIAVANPQHAPYGRIAVEALKKLGLYDKVQGRLVIAENVSQAFEFVQTGNADMGLVAMALAKTDNAGLAYVEVPDDLYPPLHQSAVLVKRNGADPRARRFLDFLRMPAATEILKKYGFGIPVKAVVKEQGTK